ncbi:tripartite tricarboxylate transporter TctB family protein [Azospirillum sp. TSO22-1]|uniref:tripartite tricarboxylate transporter TctB family protein n=1 Tax=Azospirillum sp. TSO22-1 TaxID=716789 RepID=UPI000D640F5C|nr:tripartite tricarboxylate transporter TctB family protein [Azospirillum sp. TSO22-1]
MTIEACMGAERAVPARAGFRASPDGLAAALFAALGAVALWLAFGHALGTAARMGPGFFPAAVAGLLVLASALVAAGAWVGPAEPVERGRLRPLASVLGAVLAFGLAIDRLGFLLSAALLFLIAGQAVPGTRLRATLALAAGVGGLTWLVFVKLLGIPLPTWPR